MADQEQVPDQSSTASEMPVTDRYDELKARLDQQSIIIGKLTRALQRSEKPEDEAQVRERELTKRETRIARLAALAQVRESLSKHVPNDFVLDCSRLVLSDLEVKFGEGDDLVVGDEPLTTIVERWAKENSKRYQMPKTPPNAEIGSRRVGHAGITDDDIKNGRFK